MSGFGMLARHYGKSNMANNILLNIYDLQTRLFNNVISEISDGNAGNRASEKVNHIKWLAGHMVSVRYLMAALLGANETEKYAELFSQFKGLQPDVTYPSVEEMKNEWDKISKVLRPLIANITAETLAGPIPFPVPVAEQNISGFLSFCLHHEAYHIGQLGILRKYHGYKAMSYN